jgi:hypothetical protein
MNKTDAVTVITKVWADIFGTAPTIDFDDFMQKFAFDIRLPSEVTDYTTGLPSWVDKLEPMRFMTNAQADKLGSNDEFARPTKELRTVEDVLAAWKEVHTLVSEHVMNSENVSESDKVYRSQNVFRSTNILDSNNVVLCEYDSQCEYTIASRRSGTSQYCIRLDNSVNCSSSYEVALSAKVSKSMYIYNCFDMYECLFCTNISGKKYCIANMQYEKEDYFKIKALVVSWINRGGTI